MAIWGHEFEKDWGTCADCECRRPLKELVNNPIRGEARLVCKDLDWCHKEMHYFLTGKYEQVAK